MLHYHCLRLFAEHSLAPLGEYLRTLLLAAGFVFGDVGVVTRVDQAVGALQKLLLLSGLRGLIRQLFIRGQQSENINSVTLCPEQTDMLLMTCPLPAHAHWLHVNVLLGQSTFWMTLLFIVR